LADSDGVFAAVAAADRSAWRSISRDLALRPSSIASARYSATCCSRFAFCACWKFADRSNGSSLPDLKAVFSSGRFMISSTLSFCQNATPKQTRNAATQMISRVRSSSRCSTRLRRSS